MTRPRFTLSDQHNWNGKTLAPVEGCCCQKCNWLRAFEEDWNEDVRSDPFPNDFNRRAAA